MAIPDTTDTLSIRKIAAASLLGSVVEWYDFFLYGTMAALVFNKQFFPEFDPLVGTMIAFATFAAGFITRPLGGFIFGHFGDRIGRKRMLVMTMLIMGLSTFIMGLLPNYTAVGIAAPVLLLILRMLQGIGLGGEWGGAVLLCVEHAPAGRRGWYSSWPQLGVPIGLLTSTIAVTAVTALPDEDFQGWGWRIPFLISIVLVIVGLIIRLRIDEPPPFKSLEALDNKAKLPLLEVVTRHPKVTLLAMGARVSESVTFNVYNAFLLTFTVTVLNLDKSIVLNALLVAAVVGFGVILAAGRMSDRVGRRPVFGAGAALALVSAFPIFWLVTTGNPYLITLAVVIGWGFAACTMFGPEGALFAEVFPTRVRYSGMSLVYQVGVIPTGAVAPLIATSLVSAFTGSAWPVAVYVMAMAAITLVSLYFLPETNERDINDADADADLRRDKADSATAAR
ncbi:MFS transporter [Mycolicibacterium agri]|uniref:Putative proline/betaine transporter n=1 Tax=Mycolicibacterium agri TaxID=36811 RepID=A0A2A7N842_MYCAG|nr:MFS transporter [Mycolicibacterium agri]PEG39943.1 MFS transporter [Mycolicibacterium agri]GFG51443.1 MFS transporter [Mycolicibacterium agri]